MPSGSKHKSQHWTVEAPTLTTHDGCSRVTALIDGEALWFESSDIELRASAEAFASLLFIPALLSDSQYKSVAPLDQTWHSGTQALLPILKRWWNTSDQYPLTAPIRQSDSGPISARGLCFSGGVDSLYEYISAEADIDYLIFAHGFDIDVDDQPRMDAHDATLRDIARDSGKPAIVLRTNARKHHVFGACDWERTHGAALAAMGHVLSNTIGHLRIAASWSYPADQPWGSHWDTDPLWSGGEITIEHGDATYTRQEKIKLIANHPLAHKHLRVCWENLTRTGNCCRCAKCVRTMLSFHVCGTLEKFSCFPERDNLAARLDAIPYLSEALHGPAYVQLAELQDPELHAAMERLLKRKPAKGIRKRINRILGW